MASKAMSPSEPIHLPAGDKLDIGHGRALLSKRPDERSIAARKLAAFGPDPGYIAHVAGADSYQPSRDAYEAWRMLRRLWSARHYILAMALLVVVAPAAGLHLESRSADRTDRTDTSRGSFLTAGRHRGKLAGAASRERADHRRGSA